MGQCPNLSLIKNWENFLPFEILGNPKYKTQIQKKWKYKLQRKWKYKLQKKWKYKIQKIWKYNPLKHPAKRKDLNHLLYLSFLRGKKLSAVQKANYPNYFKNTARGKLYLDIIQLYFIINTFLIISA